MQIVKYELIKKGYYNVYLSSGEVITLSDKVITENELLLKKEIDRKLYDKLLYDNKIYEYMEMGIRYISVRLRSIKEIRDYLIKKGASIDISDKVVNELIKNKYLDDNTFTKAFIKDKLNFTNMGDYKLKRELERLGIDTSIIDNNLSNIDDSIYEERMKKIIDKDIRINKKYEGIKLKNKIFNHLLNQGYSKEKVISMINKYNFQYKSKILVKDINGDTMKKISILFIFLFLLIGCSLSNTPTSQVEDLLTKYQTLDSDIETGINNILDSENLTISQRERYRKLIESQYKNIAYEIKDETIDGDNATVTVEVELLDYKKAINETNLFYQGNTDYTV